MEWWRSGTTTELDLIQLEAAVVLASNDVQEYAGEGPIAVEGGANEQQLSEFPGEELTQRGANQPLESTCAASGSARIVEELAGFLRDVTE